MSKKIQKVLVVMNENDRIFARVSRNKFQKEKGWDVTITNDYDECLDKVVEIKPNLIITEIIINDTKSRSGFDLIKDIKKISKDSKIVVFSVLTQESDKNKALDLGANKYYSKNQLTILEFMNEIEKHFIV